jgi:predicted nucleotidyltransferase
MRDIKEEAKEALKKVYEKYNSLGLEAIYLDGSILTRDFNPETSDVDSIGIVADSFPVDLEDIIKIFLAKEYPKINKFGFRLLYKSELNGGPIKAFFSSVIEPQILLSDLPYWELVVGIPFTQKDFKLPIATYNASCYF